MQLRDLGTLEARPEVNRFQLSRFYWSCLKMYQTDRGSVLSLPPF
jgi:hypothetical protein